MHETLEERLEAIILEAPDIVEPSVEITRDGPWLVVSVVSSSFEGVDEAERQAMIWDILEGNLSSEEHRRVEFVFTDSPREQAA